jgi:hypothetical protein
MMLQDQTRSSAAGALRKLADVLEAEGSAPHASVTPRYRTRATAPLA